MLLTANELTFSEQLTPYLPFLGVVIGAIVVGSFAVWNRRRGATETKIPTVSEIWAREERISRRNRWLEGYIAKLRAAFHAYADRVQEGGSVELTSFEQNTLDADLSEESTK